MFGFIGNIGPWELSLIMIVVLIVVGPGKLPDVGKAMGSAMKNFKAAKNDLLDDTKPISDSE